VNLLTNNDVMISSTNSLTIVPSQASGWVGLISGSEESKISAWPAINRNVIRVKDLDTSVIVDVEKLIEGPTRNGGPVNHKFRRQAPTTVLTDETKMGSLGYLNSIGVTLRHSIETPDDTLTCNSSIVSSEILEVISI